MLHYQSCAVCPCPCCISMSIMHVHVHVTCPCQCCMSMSIYIEMPECRTIRHPVSPVSDWKKLTMPEQIQYRTKLTQSGIFLVQNRIKIRNADAGVSFLDADAQLCPTPRTGKEIRLKKRNKRDWLSYLGTGKRSWLPEQGLEKEPGSQT